MGITEFMAAQLRQPNGWFGSLVMSRLLNRVNSQIVDATLAILDVRAEHHVLEVGFGGGSALSRLVTRTGTGLVEGVDVSTEMVKRAEHKFQREIEVGRLRVQLGDVVHLPFRNAIFDRIFTINTIYFWPDAEEGMGEVHRVLKQDGTAAVAIRSKEKMEQHAVSKHGFRLFSPDDVADLMCRTGFRNVRVEHRDRDKWYDQVIVVGSR